MRILLCAVLLGLVSVHDVSAAAAAEAQDSLKLRKRLIGHTALVRAALYLHDGRLATGSDDATVRLWNLETAECLDVLPGHTRAVTGLANLIDDAAIASCSDDGTVRVWNLQTQSCTRVINHVCGPARSLAIARNGYVVLEKNNKKHIEYHPLTGEPFREGKHAHWGIVYQGEPDPAVALLRKHGKEAEAESWSKTMRYLVVDHDMPVPDVASYSFVLNTAEFLAQGNGRRDPIAVLKQLNAIKQLQPDCLVSELTLLSDGNIAVRKASRLDVVQIMSNGELLQEIRGCDAVTSVIAGLPGGGLAIGAEDGAVDIYLYDQPKRDILLCRAEEQDEGKEERGGLIAQAVPGKQPGVRSGGGCCVIS